MSHWQRRNYLTFINFLRGVLVSLLICLWQLYFLVGGGKEFLFHRDLFRIGYIANLYLASLKFNRHSHTSNPITWTSEICLLWPKSHRGGHQRGKVKTPLSEKPQFGLVG